MSSPRHVQLPRGRPAGGGFSLVELLVSMAIGLVVTLAVTRVLIYSQEARLTTTTLNDVNQGANYVALALDRAVRSAGSGFSQQRRNFGCLLNASRASTVLLPAPSALPAPFASVTGPFRLAPVVVFPSASSAGSDVIAVMTGASGFGEVAVPLVTGKTTSTQVQVVNTVGFVPDGLLLLADEALSACMVQQISSSFADPGDQTLPLAGSYYTATGAQVNLVDFGVSGTSYATALGQQSATVVNPPEFKLYGVGDNLTLFSYDLLRMDGVDTAVPVSDGVVEMHAVYRVDTDGDGKADGWRDPGASPSVGYAPSELLDGSTGARSRLASIVALRVGLILRTSLAEKTPPAVAQDTYTLFSGLAGVNPVTRTLSAGEKSYRFRTLEFTIPVRNLLMDAAP
jgi:type IV pilus assembly protein PilW